MKLRSILLVAVLLLPFFSFAQSDYKPGYVVTVKGDTVRGFINLREWTSNPSSIQFKQSLSRGSTNYSTQAISSFDITNMESYVRYIGPISNDNTEANNLSNRDTSFRTDTVFLKVLQKGRNISLFSYADNSKTRFFITDKFNPAPAELIYRIYYGYTGTNTNSGASEIKTEDRYKQQLLLEADKLGQLDEKFSLKVQQSKYELFDLLKITDRLNNDGQTSSSKSATKGFVSFYAGAGISATFNSTDATSGYAKSGGTANTSILPMVDGGIMIYSNPNTRRMALVLDLSLSANQFSSSYNNQVYPYVPITYKFTQIAAAVTPQITYNFYNTDNFKFYTGVGFSFIYSQFLNKTFTSTQTKNISSNDPFILNPGQGTPTIAAGFIINKKWNINCRYLFSTNTTNSPFFIINATRAQTCLNYIF